MTDQKEAIELLEKLYDYLFMTGKEGLYKNCGKMMIDFDQALVKLRTAPEPTKWKVYIEYLELSQKIYHLEYDDRHIANLTEEQYESFKKLYKAPEQPPAGELRKEVDLFFDNMDVENTTLATAKEDVRQIVRYLKDALNIIDTETQRADKAEGENKALNYQFECTKSHYKRSKEYTACYINMLMECLHFTEPEKANLSVLAGAETVRRKIEQLEAKLKDLESSQKELLECLVELVDRIDNGCAYNLFKTRPAKAAIAKAKKEE